MNQQQLSFAFSPSLNSRRVPSVYRSKHRYYAARTAISIVLGTALLMLTLCWPLVALKGF
ncbi:MAG: hypothetical protein Q7P63_13815 [Verrucomicrobiota bacterium JB022]|nr:hypothetical protein [Verrucomicrobiota bacterium JB022]